MTDPREPHPTGPSDDEQNPSPAMTIDIDPALAPLAAELSRQINAEAAGFTPRRPSVDQLLLTPRRPSVPTPSASRFRLVAAAAAVLVVLAGAFVLRGGNDASDVKVVDDPVPVVHWRVAIDPSSQYVLTDASDDAAVRRLATTPGGTSGTLIGQEALPTAHAIAYRPEGAAGLRAPWMEVTMLVYPEGTTGTGITGGGTPMSVGSYEGWRFAEGPSSGHFGFTLDGRHEIDVKRWGVSEADAIAAAATIRVVDGPDGFELTSPPAGLAARPEAATPVLDTQRLSYSTVVDRARPPLHLDLEVRHVPAEGADLAMTVLLGQSSSTPLDQAEIESVPFRDGTALMRAVDTSTFSKTVLVTWADRVHEQVGVLRLSGTLAGSARTEATRVLESLHEVDDATWQDMVRRCPGMHAGTVPSTAVGSC